MNDVGKRPYRADGGDISTGRLKEIADNPYGDEEKCWLAKRLLASLSAGKEQEESVRWGAPKTVKQLIGQLQTLDPDLETTGLLRMPADFRDGNAVRQVPLSISYERMDGQWLAPYKSDHRKVLAFWAKPDDRNTAERGEELYTPPPAPVSVPDFKKLARELVENLVDCDGADDSAVKQYLKWTEKTCRDAMLQGAEPVTTAYKLPEGWVAVPVEPTEDMIVNGFESEPDESFSDEKEWEAYEAMSGCQQAAHRAKLCWSAMLAAAPKPEA